MAGISLEVEIEDVQVLKRLSDLVDRMSNPKPFYGAVGEELVGSTAENFRNEAGPDGGAWVPHSQSTIKSRIRKGQMPLSILRSNTGGKSGSTLAGSISHQPTATEVRVGSPSEYAAIHQLGGTIKKKARKGKAFGRDDVQFSAHEIKIPARPFIGIGAYDWDLIFETADDWLHDS